MTERSSWVRGTRIESIHENHTFREYDTWYKKAYSSIRHRVCVELNRRYRRYQVKEAKRLPMVQLTGTLPSPDGSIAMYIRKRYG